MNLQHPEIRQELFDGFEILKVLFKYIYRVLCINPNNFIFTLRDRSKMQEYCCIYFRNANIYKSMETLNNYLNGVFLVFL